jgi:hypothetical protein
MPTLAAQIENSPESIDASVGMKVRHMPTQATKAKVKCCRLALA